METSDGATSQGHQMPKEARDGFCPGASGGRATLGTH